MRADLIARRLQRVIVFTWEGIPVQRMSVYERWCVPGLVDPSSRQDM